MAGCHGARCLTTTVTQEVKRIRSQKPESNFSVGRHSSGHKAKTKRSLRKSFSRLVLFLLGAFYLILPFWFSLGPWIRRQIIFLNNVNLEFYVDMTAPEKYGFPCSKHFTLESTNGARLGAWHIPPASMVENQACHSFSVNNTIEDLDFESDRPVILYLHGTGFSRAAFFRRRFYKTISRSAIDGHVVAFDYRGFGDSTNEMVSIPNVVEDADAAYQWLLKRVRPKSRIVLWGHSLGSGVAVQLAHRYAGTDSQPGAVILESTFTNMVDAVKSFPFSALHRFWPMFDQYVAQVAGYHPETSIFNDIKMSRAVASPILILHSEDDQFLHVNQARRLYRLGHLAVDESAINTRKGLPTLKLIRPKYFEFEASLGYGHKACVDPRVPKIFNDFLDGVKRQINETRS